MRYAVYVSNADGGDLAVLHLDADTGALAEFQRVPVGPVPMPLALSPDARFLYAAQRGEPWRILSFRIDAVDGRLTQIGAAPLPNSMACITTDRSGLHIFSASYAGHLIAVGPIDPQGAAGSAQQVLETPPHAHKPTPSSRRSPTAMCWRPAWARRRAAVLFRRPQRPTHAECAPDPRATWRGKPAPLEVQRGRALRLLAERA